MAVNSGFLYVLLSSANLSYCLQKLRGTFYLPDNWFIVNEYKTGWPDGRDAERTRSVELSSSVTIPHSLSLHVFNNLETLLALSFWFIFCGVASLSRQGWLNHWHLAIGSTLAFWAPRSEVGLKILLAFSKVILLA